MHFLITGSKGFIGKNLLQRLSENRDNIISCFNRGGSLEILEKLVKKADVIIHLAAENRPKNDADFITANSGLTQHICNFIKKSENNPIIVFTSSIQAKLKNPYGISKLESELALEKLSSSLNSPVIIYRLPGVFGKWCKPNYNSVVATFCHNIANDLSIEVHDSSHEIRLTYIDDLIDSILSNLKISEKGVHWARVKNEYQISLGELSSQIKSFQNVRNNLVSEKVGEGITRALYSTYISYLPFKKFAYDLNQHLDERGVFVELLKTKDSGQFSFFTANPGVTRGEHYHHSKTEKFIVIKGEAQFGFRNILSGESHELFVNGDNPQVVETVPGWAHNIKNVGNNTLIVILWANEIFNLNQPDTISCEV